MVLRGEGKGRVVADGMNDDLLAGMWHAGVSRVGAGRHQAEMQIASLGNVSLRK